MDSATIRRSFQEFFESKKHEIVPSASLLPTAPNLLFTNAGMNPFVPYFLEERESPYPRIANTQKCIRAGGKHNDLEDVGYDTYHHTFFEMLGNWSIGDYFKKEAIEWGWELLTKVWKIPKERLYVTIYSPKEGDPAEFDQEAYDLWAMLLSDDGLDPEIHIVHGDAKDNFWMMGETGPCGPCSEIHMDLTEKGDTKGNLVNQDSAYCKEIWNLVFIQFNATPEGDFVPLKNQHVDTGMGLERVAGIFASTDGFTKYGKVPSNYDSDLFTDLFKEVEKLCDYTYSASVPTSKENLSEQESVDIRMRALADHLRAVCFAIGDGILPGNEGRNYVIRHILRRGILASQKLGLKLGDFSQLVNPLIEKMGPHFPELQERSELVRKVIASEEESFYRTLEKGLSMFDRFSAEGKIDGASAFNLYDTYGFPFEMTQMIASERGIDVDEEGFHKHMEEQRERARAAQKKSVITVKSGDGESETKFVGYDPQNWKDFTTEVLASVDLGDEVGALTFRETPFYGEKGGQVGDTGTVSVGEQLFHICNTTIDEDGVYLHHIDGQFPDDIEGKEVKLSLDSDRRRAIQRHHTATHVLHWALRKVVGEHVHQAGSLVTEDRLRFDFSHFEKLSDQQLEEIEQLVVDKILQNEAVVDFETPFDQKPADVLAFFEDKYGDVVRVVDIGGYSKELCAGTHTKTTGEIGFLKIVQESAIAAGSRRIEAVVGKSFSNWNNVMTSSAQDAAQLLKCSPSDLVNKLGELLEEKKKIQKQLSDLRLSLASQSADALLKEAKERNGLPWLGGVLQVGHPNDLRSMGMRLLKSLDDGVVLLGAEFGDKVTLVVHCGPKAIEGGAMAGNILKDVVGKLGGKGGGKPDFAMGGAPNNGKLAEAIASV